jgi:hypothetical protein
MGETVGTPVDGVVKPLVGRTTLKINSATMFQAVEEYLTSKVFKDTVNIKVESIRLTKEGQCPSWDISIQAKEN